MATEDQKQPLESNGKRYLTFSQVFMLTLSVAMILTALIIVFTLRSGVPAKSAAFEKAIGVLQIATPVLTINAIIIFFMTISAKFTAQASEKSALPAIQKEMGTIKTMVEDMKQKVTNKAPKRAALEDLLEQLKLFSSQLNETVDFALKMSEKAELIVQKLDNDGKEQNELPEPTCRKSKLPGDKDASEQAPETSCTYNDVETSTKDKINFLVEVVKELLPDSSAKSVTLERPPEEIASLIDAVLKISEKRGAKEACPADSCEVSELKTPPTVKTSEEQPVYLAETSLEVSEPEKLEPNVPERTDEVEACSEN